MNLCCLTNTMESIHVLFLLCLVLGLCDGFLETGTFRCGVTEWTAWNKPYIYGIMYRERQVLEHPPEGDDVCMDRLYEVDLDPSKYNNKILTAVILNKPYIYGIMYRERQILEHPPEGDDVCMDRLYEVDLDPNPDFNNTRMLPLNVRVDLVIDYFLRRSRSVINKRGTTPTKDIRDLVLIVDASGSVGSANFKKSLFELTALLSAICPSPDPFNRKYNHAAMLVFSSNVYEIFDFNTYSNTSQLFDAIRTASYTSGGTHTGEAFVHAAQQTLNTGTGLRRDPNIKREVLILTDGQSNGPRNAIQEAKKLHALADVFSLAIGTPLGRGQIEIRSYVSNNIPNHLFAVSTFTELSTLISATLQKLKSKPGLQCLIAAP